MLVAANLLIKPFWILGVDLQVQNVVGAETYGLFYAVFNFSFLFHILLDIGINQFNNREVAQDPNNISTFFGNLLFLKILLSFVYLAVTFGIAFQIGFSAFQLKLLAFLALNQVFYSGVLFARSNFTALHWFKWDIFFSVLDRLLAIILCVLLIYTNVFAFEFKIEHFVYAQSFALGISASISLVVLLLKAKVTWPTFNYDELKSLLKQSFPYALAILVMSIYMRVDAIMIERILPETGQYEAGIYAAAYRLLDAANMIPFLFASILIPVTARFLKENKAFQPLMNASLNFLLCISILTAIVVYFLGNEILSLLYVDSTSYWYYTFVLLFVVFNFTCINYIFGSFLTAAGKMIYISKLGLVALVVNITFNYFLIMKYGAAGAALATLITQIVVVVGNVAYTVRYWKINYSWLNILKFGLYAAILVAVAYFSPQFIEFWIYNLFIISVIAVILAFALRLIDKEILLQLPKYKNEQRI